MADENVRSSDPRNLLVVEGASLWLRNKGSTDPADWREVGSVMDVEFDPTDTRLEHFSNRRGARVKDREIITERKLGINFRLEEVNLHNLQYAFGDTEDPEVGSKDVKDSAFYANPGDGLVIELGKPDVKNVIVRSGALDGSEVTYTEGVDYTENLAAGELTILGGGALADEDVVPEVHIFFEKAVDGQTFQLFPGLEIEIEAQFQVLGNGGTKQVYQIPSAVLKVNGALQFGNGDAWQAVPMRLEALGGSSGALGEGFVVDEGELD
ncbi:MAG: hypothetical protein ACRD1X_12325 [Vicinamibacteria bacterium]